MIDFDLTEEQQTLRDVANTLLQKECSIDLVRKTIERGEGFPRGLWRKASEAGWLGLIIPEAYGGANLTCVELAIVLDEMERVLFPGPFVETAALAPTLITLYGSDNQKLSLLPKIARGELTISCSLGEEIESISSTKVGSVIVGRQTKRNSNADREYVISGTKRVVPFAEQSNLVLVPISLKEGLAFGLVDPKSQSVKLVEEKAVDPTMKLYSVTFEDTLLPKENIIKSKKDSIGMLNQLITLGAICLSAQSVGGATKVLDMTVEYAKTREQFGRPIGSFQAIKHKCADMLLMLEAGTAAAYYAAWAYSKKNDDISTDAHTFGSIAKAYCSEMYSRIAGQSIQVHGGVGFTWQHDLHLYFKRAKRYEFSFGDPSWHRDRIAKKIIDGTAISSQQFQKQTEMEQLALGK
jgi:alkylation response protein AidB-like acyl-CoA dehydrogenase